MSRKQLTPEEAAAVSPLGDKESIEKMVTRRSQHQHKSKDQGSDSPDVVIEEELSTPLPASPLAVDDSFSNYTWLEMKQELDWRVSVHKEWLQKIGLLEYAMLPWKHWSSNHMVSNTLLHVQNTK